MFGLGTVTDNELQFGFMSERKNVFRVYYEKAARRVSRQRKQAYICSVDLEKAFVRVPLNVLELAMRKKGILDVLVRSLMSLYGGARTRFKVDSES